MPSDHSYEEIRKVAIEILSGKVKTQYGADQFENFKISILEIFQKRDPSAASEIDYLGPVLL